MRLSQKSVKEVNRLIEILEVSKFDVSLIPVKIKEKERTFTVPNSYGKDFLRKLLGSLEDVVLPPYVFSQKGFSFIDKARFHKNDDYLISLDIKNFFPSIHFMRVSNVFKTLGIAKDNIEKLTKVTTYNGKVPLGFPTSSVLANLVFQRVDVRLYSWASSRGLRYSRYVDDLTFSGKRLTLDMIKTPIRIIESNDWKVNRNKISPLYGKRETKYLMGLSISNGRVAITESYKAELLKNIKEYKTLIYDGVSEDLADEVLVIKGKLNFIKQVNLEDYRSLLQELSN